MVLRIAKLELSKLFSSPIAWFVLALFAAKTGIEVSSHLANVYDSAKYGSFPSLTFYLFSLNDGIVSSVATSLFIFLPLLTMGLISQEVSSGSIKLLYSSPLKLRSLVLGKYLAILTFSLLLLLIVAVVSLIIGREIVGLDVGLASSAMLSLLFLVASYCAVGLFVSALTSYQVVAAIITVAVLGLLDFLGSVAQGVPVISDIFYWLSISSHIDQTRQGLITSSDVIYYLVIALLFLYLTHASLESKRLQGQEQTRRRLGMVVAVAVAMLIGYVASLPILSSYKDMTAVQSHTLNPTTSELMDKLAGDLQVVTYANVLRSSKIRPDAQVSDSRGFAIFRRHTPELALDYSLYYSGAARAWFLTHRTDLNEKEKAERLATIYGVDLAEIASLEDLLLSEPKLEKVLTDVELRKFISGDRSSYMKETYGDMYLNGYASEEEQAAAIKLLTVDPVQVGVVTGHLEAGFNKNKESDWGSLLIGDAFRHSLANNGFEVESLSLSAGDVPQEIELLVIANPKTAFSDTELQALQTYVEQGRNLLIAIEPQYAATTKPLLELLSLTSSSQPVFSDQREGLPLVVEAGISPRAVSALNGRATGSVSLTSTAALSVDENSPFTSTPVLISNAAYTWIDNQSVVGADSMAPTAELGEKKESFTLLSLLSRQQNGRTQKVVVSGGASLFSNAMARESMNVGAPNTSVLLNEDLFAWLSDDRFPVRLRAISPKDTTTTLTHDRIDLYKFLFMFVLPAIFFALGAATWVRNRRR